MQKIMPAVEHCLSIYNSMMEEAVLWLLASVWTLHLSWLAEAHIGSCPGRFSVYQDSIVSLEDIHG